MISKKQKIAHAGFTLVEVLVSSLLIMLGVTGYVSLQSEYVFADAELNLRIIAVRLAQQKIADLSYFQNLDDFQRIRTNLGGSLPSGKIEKPLTSELNTHSFALQWLVEDLYLVDSNFDEIADRWVKAGEPFYPLRLPQYPHLKSVKVQVIWLDDSADSKQVDLYCHLAPMSKGLSFHTKYRTDSAFAMP